MGTATRVIDAHDHRRIVRIASRNNGPRKACVPFTQNPATKIRPQSADQRTVGRSTTSRPAQTSSAIWKVNVVSDRFTVVRTIHGTCTAATKSDHRPTRGPNARSAAFHTSHTVAVEMTM